MKGRMRKITGILLAFVLCIGTASQSGAVTIDEAEKKADQLESDKKKAEEEKKTLSEKLDEIIKKMNETQEHLTAKEDEISDAENELIQAQIAEDDQYDSMKKRIRYLYEGGNTQFLEMMMTSSSITDLLNKAEYVAKLSSYDRDMLVEFQDTVKTVQDKEAKLQEEYKNLNTLQSQLVEQQTQAQEMISSKEAQIASIQTQIQQNADTLKELKEKAEQWRKFF